MSNRIGAVEVDPRKGSSRSFLFTAAVLLTALVVTLTLHFIGHRGPPWLDGVERSASVVWPQGWSYFNSVSDQGEVVVYSTAGNGGLAIVTSIQMSDEGGWGWSRAAFMQAVETQEIVVQVPPHSWITCGAMASVTCLAKATAVGRSAVDSRVADPTLCGALVLSEEIPQGWTRKRRPPVVPRSVLRAVGVQVDCGRP